jgi:Riboflavin kinase
MPKVDTFPELNQQMDGLALHGGSTNSCSSILNANGSTSVQSPASSIESPTGQSKWKIAMEEARFFAGSIISHPYESTKHYSILRHSHGLVYYKGSFTNLVITIFADRPLPEDRTLWLQRRGWSGKTGLKAGAHLGTKSAWINVTPTVSATADQLPPSDERAWQRDIRKFLEKVPKDLRHHQVRETNVLRIPFLADDGYLRVVLCTGVKGKKMLCPSPVFRLASTSTSASSIRGASLSTLPMEVGLKVATGLAKKATFNAISPITSAVRDQLAQREPDFITQQAAFAAYDATGIQGKIDNFNQQYEFSRDISYQQTEDKSYDEYARPDLVGDDTGPQSPYPVRFTGKVMQGSGRSKQELGMPTANLDGVPDDILLRYAGTYLGWAQIIPGDKKLALEVPGEWLQAIISFTASPEPKFQVVLKKTVRVYLIHDFQGASFFADNLSIIMMGFLRPENDAKLSEDAADNDAQLFNIYKDIMITQASLARPAWSAEETLSRIKFAASHRSLAERYIDLRTSGQKQMDRVPLQKAGIRTNSAGLRDQLVGNGGICVHR